MQDVISAIATPHGSGGVAIIRLSGGSCLDIAKKMFSLKRESFEPNRMYAGNILADGFSDYGFMVYFRAPKSFTGEDVVEFHCHGGAELARAVLKKTVTLGARLAERGEFTKRAFLNGKLSLASAEGMADMINAESLALLRAGSMLYSEKLTDKVRAVQDKLKTAVAGVAVEIDYPEEDAGGADFAKLKRDIGGIYGEISELISTYSTGKKIKNGVSVAICGKPNAGKSSVLNALLGYDKAIVSSEAGTTRDAVEGCLELGGVKYNLVDTAGIRETSGEVESIGIERAKALILSADVVLLLSDGEDAELPAGITGKLIRVFNKIDERTPEREYDLKISAKTGQGIDELKQTLMQYGAGDTSADKAYIVEERHYDALSRAGEALKSTVENMDMLTADLIAVDLKEAWDALGEITGETASEEIVNTIFAKFCVGK